MTKTVLVTGGAGFIGSNFVHLLLRRYPDYRFLVLDNFTYAASIDNLPEAAVVSEDDRVQVWVGNVCNADLVATLMAQSDMVVHFAAETHVTRSIFDNLTFFQTDVMGTHAVANAVVKFRDRIERFVHISTSEVYGTAADALMSEEHPLNPMSPYASAKCGADRLVYSYWATYQIPAVIVRPFNNYGPQQHLEKVIPRFVTSVLVDEPLTVHGDGSAARDFIFVEDCCNAIDLVCHAPTEKVVGQVFNVASGHDISILDIARAVCKQMGSDGSRISFIGDRPGQVFRHTGDWSKINRVLGWSPTRSWEQGLEQTIAWYCQNRPWWEKQMWMRHIPITTAAGKKELH
ncbi:MAG: GDP-mannose 4,6-dehydratase [Alphaproteobacteria bacterium]|nr:GDP-mannose 4,6-dehydratase [Alphaproteobacteria bacterium]